MKRIIMFVLLFAALKVAGQTTGYLRFDTVKIMKQNGSCELYIINKTKDSLGLLTNVGGGLTQFIKSKMLNDSTIVIGLDTLLIRGGDGGSAVLNNVGAGHRLVTTPNGSIKTIFFGYGLTGDSTTNTNGITIKADTTGSNPLVTTSDLNDAIAGVGGGPALYSDLGPLSETKIFSPAKGVSSSDVVTNYSHNSVDTARYKFSTTAAGTGGNEYGGWLTPNTSGDSIKVTAPFWIVFGDSQAEGHPGLHGRLHPLVSGSGQNIFTYNYPDSIGQLSYHLRGLTNMRWYNHGIGGQTTVDMRKRFYRDVLGLSSPNSSDGRGERTLLRMPQGVVIIGGINDIFNSIPQETIQANLEWMASQCQQNGIRCVILNIPGDAFASQDILQVIASVNTWLKSGVMDQYGACVVDYNSWWNDPAYGYDNVHHTSLIVDDIHPTKVGYDSLANYIYRQARLPKITKVRFINELDPAGFTGYSRPANITINSAPYTITSSDDLINISTYVPDSVWIKIISSTNITGTSYTGFSHIEWFSDNNPLDSPYYTKRTLFSGSQKANMNGSSLLLQAPTLQDGYTALDIKLASGTSSALQVKTSSSGSSLIVNNMDSTATPANMVYREPGTGIFKLAAVPSGGGGSLNPSDTVGRFWSLSGNTLGGTKYFGGRDNEDILFISNNIIRGGLAANGEWRLGDNSDQGVFPIQLNKRTVMMGESGNQLVVQDDGANASNATTVLNIASNALPNLLLTTPSGASTLILRDYGQTTDLFTIGEDNNVSLTHLLSDAATSGSKYAYGAYNTFSPTSGTAARYAFEDATTVNQTGGASGVYASFYAHPTLTAAADPRAFWNTVGKNVFNSNSGNTLIGTATDNSIGKLQVNGKVTIATTDSSGSPANMLWVTPAGEIKKAAVPGSITVYKGSTSWTPGVVASGSSATTNITVTGALPGDPVTVSKATGGYGNGELYDAFVSASNTVTIRVHNVSTGSANYNTSETYNVVVLKY